MVHETHERPAALIVDHDPWTRVVASEVLAQAGYDVQEASNGSAALRVASRDRPALVVLDLALPEQSGVSVLEWLKSSRPMSRVPVIVMSREPEGLLANTAVQADVVIQKPFTPSTLLAGVECAQRPARIASTAT